ncbi:MAG: glycosyltransferase family 4 protein [Bacteroidetes bacterium]|nr:glycosyltransferase family 4 protein [Bacteroidota bacterium]
MISEEKYVFIFLNAMGGVPSFYQNIIGGQQLIPKHKIKVILLDNEEDDRPKLTEFFPGIETITFRFSGKQNQYFVRKKLGALIGSEPGAVITDNVLALQAASETGNQKTVFHLLHDYFYVNQNVQCGDMIDVAIAHSSFFADAVFASSPRLFADRVFYIPYGVKQLSSFPVKKKDSPLQLVFLGRLSEGKGVNRLIEIEEGLKKMQVNVEWTIIGKGPLKEKLKEQWKSKSNITFKEPDTSNDVYNILAAQDIFIFPTLFEGTPVSILECMANGVITIANDLPGGIRDLLKKDTGFTCKTNDISSFMQHIAALDKDRNKLKEMQENCFALTQKQYELTANANNYFKLFMNYKQMRRPVKTNVLPSSKLDNRWLPGGIVKFLRTLRFG